MSEFFKKIFNKDFYKIIIVVAFFEIASYFGFAFPKIGNLFFWIIFTSALILSFKNIKYGLWLAIIEILIGSKGYLFFTNIAGFSVSIRIAIWSAVMLAWFIYLFSSIFKPLEKKSIFLKAETYRQGYVTYFLILFSFIVIALVNGLLRHNIFSNVFFDFNAWLYFSLFFPLYELFFNKNIFNPNPLTTILRIFSAGMVWLFLKTFFLLYIFSHTFPTIFIYQLYRWVRNTGVGEITMMPSGFVRIFFQSHIFILIAFYAILMLVIKFSKEIKANRKLLLLAIVGLVSTISLIMISYSRSFWVGLIAVFPFFVFICFKKYHWRKIFFGIILTFFSVILSVGLIASVVKFPVPKPGVEFNITQALADRAQKINNEAAISSRYALLPELWLAIKSNFILGSGFGETVSYHTSDPRVLENNLDGLYTTYAFEWGWLDAWLKLGFFGAIFYLSFFLILIKDALKEKNTLSDVLAVSLLMIIVVNFFTPYINHPLGISLFLLSAIIIFFKKKTSACI